MNKTKKVFRLVVIRRPYQGNLFGSGIDDGKKHTVIATNRGGSVKEVVAWYNQRGECSGNRIKDLIFDYRFRGSYAPIHPFWLLYESQYILDHASKVIFAGVPTRENPLAPPQLEGRGGFGACR